MVARHTFPFLLDVQRQTTNFLAIRFIPNLPKPMELTYYLESRIMFARRLGICSILTSEIHLSVTEMSLHCHICPRVLFEI